MFGEEHVGRRLGRYAVEATIGAGGFATVYRAIDTALERPVALKVLDPNAHRDPTIARRFVNEGRSVARLDHSAIVPVYDAGETDGLLWLAMRLVEGPSLDQDLGQQGRRFSGAEATALIDRIAAALDHAHDLGIVHRDVKPSNILLEAGDPARAWLADFGIAVTARTSGRYTTGTLGTAMYMAPEQARTSDVGPPADIYSLGCVAYLLVAGRPPFPGNDHIQLLMAHATEPVPPVGDEALDRALGRALAKAPDDRPASAGALADELRAALGGSSVPAGYEGDAATALGFTAAHRAAVAEVEQQDTVPYRSPAVPAGAAWSSSSQEGATAAIATVPGGAGYPGAPPGNAAGQGPAPPRRTTRRARWGLVIGGLALAAAVVAGVIGLAGSSDPRRERQCDAAGICFELPDGWSLGEPQGPGRGALELGSDVVATYAHQPDPGVGDLAQAMADDDLCASPRAVTVGGTTGARCDDAVTDHGDDVVVATVAQGRLWLLSFQSGVPEADVDDVVDGISFTPASEGPA